MKVKSTLTTTPGSIYHCVVTMDPTGAAGVRMYINGVSDTVVSITDTWSTTPTYGTPSLGYRNGGASDFYTGVLDEPAVWNRELQQADEDTLFNATGL